MNKPNFSSAVTASVDLVHVHDSTFNLEQIREDQHTLFQLLNLLDKAGLDKAILARLDRLHDTVTELLGPYHQEVNEFNEAQQTPLDGAQEPWLPKVALPGIFLLPELGEQEATKQQVLSLINAASNFNSAAMSALSEWGEIDADEAISYLDRVSEDLESAEKEIENNFE